MKDTDKLKQIQRKATKATNGLETKSYEERLDMGTKQKMKRCFVDS